MTTIRNLTPHAIHLIDASGRTFMTIPAESPARAKEAVRHDRDLGIPAPGGGGYAFPVTRVEFGAVEGLPDPVEGTLLVVSLVVVQAARAAGRTLADLVTPGDLVRDAAGRPVGCRSFVRHD